MAAPAAPPSPVQNEATLAAQKLNNAAFLDSLPDTEALLASGVPIDGKDPDGFTALHRACVKGSVNMISFLLGKGASPNVEDGYGDTPLHYACFCGHVEAVRTLIQGGANPHKKSNDGKTPLQSALDENHQAVAQLIQQLIGSGAPGAAASPAAPSFAAPTAPSLPPPAPTAPPKAAGGFFSKFMGGGAATPAAGPQSPMAIAALDFTRGVIIQGALSKKRANKVLAWRQKYYVLSQSYNALFFWTGTADRVEGAIKKVRFETFLSVKLLPDKKGGRRFDLRVITGRTMNLLASSASEAGKWVGVLKDVVGKLMATVRIQATYRGHKARKELRKISEGRAKVVALIAGGGVPQSPGASVAGPKGVGKDVSKGKKKKGPAKKGAKNEEEADAAGPAGPLNADGVVIEGDLAKRNHTVMASVFNVYRTRYFVLHRSVGALVYYESKAKRNVGVNPRCIPFVSFYSTLHHLDKKGARSKAFTLRLTSGRTFVFEARSVEDATQWVAKIHSVLPRDHLAALCVQRFVRGWKARRMVRLLKAKAAELATGILAKYGAGRTLSELVKVVVKLQAYCRMRICRRKYLVLRADARAKKTGAVNQPTASRLNKLSKLSALKRELDAEEIAKTVSVLGPPILPPPPAIGGASVLPLPGLPPPPSMGGASAMPLPGLPSPGLPLPGLPMPGLPMPGLPLPGLPPTGRLSAAAGAASALSMLPPPPSLLPPPPSMMIPAPAPKVKKARWIAQPDAGSGRVFYAEVDTGETRWVLPHEIAAGTARLITGHFSMKEPGTGRKFFVFAPTGATTWETPAGYASDDDGDKPSLFQPPSMLMPGTSAVVDVSLTAFDRERVEAQRPALPAGPTPMLSKPAATVVPSIAAATRASVPFGEVLGAPVDATEAGVAAAAIADAARCVHSVRSAAHLLSMRAVRGASCGEPALSPALPPGWAETMDEASGRVAFFSLSTGASTFARPSSSDGEDDDDDDEGEDYGEAADANEVLTFSLWINDTLQGKTGPLATAVASRLPLSVEDEPPAILAAVADGLLLCALVSAVLPGSLDVRAVDVTAVAGQVHPLAVGTDGQPQSFSPAVENIRLALLAALGAGASFPKHVTAEAIAAGTPRAVMDACYGLFKARVMLPLDIAGAEGSGRSPTPGIARLSVVSEGLDELMRVSPDRLLLRWVNYHLALVPGGCSAAGGVECFGAPFADGTALCGLVRMLVPQPALAADIPVGDAAVVKAGADVAVTAALSAAFGMGLPPWFSVECVTEGNARLQLLLLAMLFASAPRLEGRLPPMAKPALVPVSLENGPQALTAAPSRKRAWAGAGKKVSLVSVNTAVGLEKELLAVLGAGNAAAPSGSLAGVPVAEAAGLAADARALVRWANSLGLEGLRMRYRKGLGLLRELRDGTALVRLLDVAEPGIVQWDRVTLAPKTRAAQVENCNVVVEVSRAMELLNLPGGGKDAVGLAAITGADIVDCNARLVLGITWQLMRYVTLRQLAAFSAFGADEAVLLTWANSCVAAAATAAGQPGDLVKIRSFGDAEMKTGMYLLYLLSYLRPGVVDWAVVADGDTREQQLANAGYVLSLARRLGAQPAVGPEDIVEVRPRAVVILVAAILLADGRAKAGPLQEGEEEDEEEEENE